MDLNLLSADQANTLIEMISSVEHIVIVGHSHPDGDALGACLAWSDYLSARFGKESTVIVPNAYPDFLHFHERTYRSSDKHPTCDGNV
jgi:phosphoesterase RecJ-like protein